MQLAGKGIGRWWMNRIGRIDDAVCPGGRGGTGLHSVPV